MYICTHYIPVIIILLIVKLILWYNERCQVIPSLKGNSWRFVATVIPPNDLDILALIVVLLFSRVVESLERVDVFFFERHLHSLSATCAVTLLFWKKPLIIQPAKTWIKLAKCIEISPIYILLRELIYHYYRAQDLAGFDMSWSVQLTRRLSVNLQDNSFPFSWSWCCVEILSVKYSGKRDSRYVNGDNHARTSKDYCYILQSIITITFCRFRVNELGTLIFVSGTVM